MATNKRRRSIKLLTCPGCSAVGTLRKIIYGMPDPETFDFEKYAVGGCCMNGDGSDPDISCRACEWSGVRLEDLSKDLGAESAIDLNVSASDKS
jgi:hypothetical protein